jgi:hypothetical protein
LIEEGIGFEVPVVKYEDKTYFSTSAEVLIQKNYSAYRVKKTYILDSVSKKFGEIRISMTKFTQFGTKDLQNYT